MILNSKQVPMLKSIQFFFSVCIILFSTAAIAQDNGGRLSFSAGVGALPTFLADDAAVNTPPVNARLTFDVSPSFRLSGYVGYSSSTSNSPFVISDGQLSLINNKQTVFGLRSEMKRLVGEKFEVYGGALLGYAITDKREFDKTTGETIIREIDGPTPFDPNASNKKFLYSAFVGTTFKVTNGIGLFAEFGYGISLLNTGITINI